MAHIQSAGCKSQRKSVIGAHDRCWKSQQVLSSSRNAANEGHDDGEQQNDQEVERDETDPESKRNAIRKGLVYELLNAQDTVLCSYFAQRSGARSECQNQGGTADQVFQGLGNFANVRWYLYFSQ